MEIRLGSSLTSAIKQVHCNLQRKPGSSTSSPTLRMFVVLETWDGSRSNAASSANNRSMLLGPIYTKCGQKFNTDRNTSAGFHVIAL